MKQVYSPEQVEGLQRAILEEYRRNLAWHVPAHELPDFRDNEFGIQLGKLTINFSVGRSVDLITRTDVDLLGLAHGLTQIVLEWEQGIAGPNPVCVGYLAGYELPGIWAVSGEGPIGESVWVGEEFRLRHVFGAVRGE